MNMKWIAPLTLTSMFFTGLAQAETGVLIEHKPGAEDTARSHLSETAKNMASEKVFSCTELETRLSTEPTIINAECLRNGNFGVPCEPNQLAVELRGGESRPLKIQFATHRDQTDNSCKPEEAPKEEPKEDVLYLSQLKPTQINVSFS